MTPTAFNKHDKEDQPQSGWSAKSFSEKSAWITLISTLGVYVPYFISLGIRHAELPPETPVFTLWFILAAFGIVVLMVAGHIASAVHEYLREGKVTDEIDERDQLIEMKATRSSAWITETGVLFAIAGLVMELHPFWLAHGLLAALALSTSVQLMLIINAYRGMR